jgi:hypothetical protein
MATTREDVELTSYAWLAIPLSGASEMYVEEITNTGVTEHTADDTFLVSSPSIGRGARFTNDTFIRNHTSSTERPVNRIL